MPKMINWQENTYWSIAQDCEMCRLSGFNEQHQEFFMAICTGRDFRERRHEAVLRIQAAIEDGNEPGEVT